MGDIPLMTDKGTFIVNGTERVIVSQMHRSPGVFFDHDKGKTHSSGKLLFAARIIPYRGSWLDFEFDAKDIVYRAHRPAPQAAGDHLPLCASAWTARRSSPPSTTSSPYEKRAGGWATPYKPERWRGVKPDFPLIDADTGEEVAPAGTKISRPPGQAPGRQRPEDPAARRPRPWSAATWPATRSTPRPARSTPKPATSSTRRRSPRWKSSASPPSTCSTSTTSRSAPYIRNTLRVDKNAVREDALFDIYRVMRPGEPPTVEAAEAMFKSLFFDQERYDLSSRRPGEDEHAPGARLPGRRARHPQGRRARGAARPWSACATAAARSTTSTTSATAGCARWANCWRTSTASACCAWSGRSRSACPASISTRSCRTT